MFCHYAPDEALAGGSPAASGQVPPGPAADAPEASDYADAPEPEAPEDGTEGETPPGTPAPAPESAPAPAPTGPSPSLQQLAGAAQQLVQVRDAISARYPVVRAQREALEGLLRGVQYDSLTPEQQQQAAQLYSQWQQAAAEEQQLTTKAQEWEQAAQQLVSAAQLEEQRATLNRVGEPIAYELLAQKYAQASGDPAHYPTADFREALIGIPADALEVVAQRLDRFVRKTRAGNRRADRVDAMGPGGGGGESWARQPARDLIRSAIADELRRNPPR